MGKNSVVEYLFYGVVGLGVPLVIFGLYNLSESMVCKLFGVETDETPTKKGNKEFPPNVEKKDVDKIQALPTKLEKEKAEIKEKVEKMTAEEYKNNVVKSTFVPIPEENQNANITHDTGSISKSITAALENKNSKVEDYGKTRLQRRILELSGEFFHTKVHKYNFVITSVNNKPLKEYHRDVFEKKTIGERIYITLEDPSYNFETNIPSDDALILDVNRVDFITPPGC